MGAQVVTRLGGALPVAIDAGPEWESTAEELDDLFLGDAELWYAAGWGMVGLVGDLSSCSPTALPALHCSCCHDSSRARRWCRQ